MENYKQRFIDLLDKRKELKEEQNKLYNKVCALNADLDSNLNDIDIVFANMQKDNYELYSSIKNNDSPIACARYEKDGSLIEIERNMGYSKPFERIKIVTKKLI